jgi:SAM-dependent methyltransferase
MIKLHGSVMEFLKSTPKEDITDKAVLEVGSLDVNGSPRTVFNDYKPSWYMGVDIREGKGVDQVIDAGEIIGYYHDGTFDTVVCTEALEHMRDWKTVVRNMKRVLKIGGLLIVTTRSVGFPVHDYPQDYWRFNIEDFRVIFSDMDIIRLDEDGMIPGVMLMARRRDNQINNLDGYHVHNVKEE